MSNIKSIAAGLCLGISAAVLTSAPSWASVMISSNSVGSQTTAGGMSATTSFNGTAIPTMNPPLISTLGTSSATTSIDYSTTGSWTTLSNTFTHTRGSGPFGGDSALSFNNEMKFTVDVASTYEISGFYNSTDGNNTRPGEVLLQSILYDRTANTFIQFYRGQSTSTMNESFMVGDAGGDTQSVNFGSLTGNLTVGHLYEWDWAARTSNVSSADGGATAMGNVTLMVHDAPTTMPMPEPGTLAIFGLGLAGLGFARRRKATA